MSENGNDTLGYNRRDFLKSGSFATLMTMMGGVELFAQPTEQPASDSKGSGAKIKVAVIGLGSWGREILTELTKLEGADVAAICDTYGAFLRRSGKMAPGARQIQDCKAILEDKDIRAVVVATPTHKHKDIVLAALKAGKHVYCEAPLAGSIEDAREIALAARAAKKQIFQAGLQMRADPQRQFLLPFIRTGALGKTVMARAQWHKKQSWRTASSDPEQEKALNWRLSKATSTGLIGEIGIHQLDVVSWFLSGRPISVMGFGSIVQWTDGRDVADTIEAVFEYPNGVSSSFESTLANSFDSEYEMFYGTDSAVMLRQNKAWMFKEVDAPLLGWEVYARKDEFYKETGIALAADATKLAAHGAKASDETAIADTPLFTALKAFIANTNAVAGGVEDFVANFGDTPKALKEYLATLEKDRLAAATAQQGFEATVIAIKANEAIAKGQRITFEKEWFEV